MHSCRNESCDCLNQILEELVEYIVKDVLDESSLNGKKTNGPKTPSS